MIPEYTFWSFNTQSSGRISPSISFRICFSLAQTSTCGWIHHNNSSVTALARLALHGQPLFAVEWIRFEAFPQNQNQLFIHKCTLTTASGSIRLLLWGRPPMEINPNLNHGQVHEHCRRWTLHKMCSEQTDKELGNSEGENRSKSSGETRRIRNARASTSTL